MLSGIIVAALWLAVLVLAMAESALTFASWAKLEATLERPAVRDRYFRYLDRAGPAKVFCIVGRGMGVVAVVAILAARFGGPSGLFAAVLTVGAAAMIAAELAGRFIGRNWATAVLIALLPPLQAAWFVALPFRLLRRKPASGPAPIPDEEVVDAAREEIRVAIEDAAKEGAILSDERDMIEGVLEFEDAEVHEIMTPRTEMECLEVDTPLPKAVEMAASYHHSRFPLYERVRDRVVGVLHVKDLLPAAVRPDAGEHSLRGLMHKPFFVPETKGAVSLLRDFKQQHLQIAVILDEYGGVTGLVTIEDVVEQIVGELEEGFEAEGKQDRIRKLGPGTLDVDARLHVDEVNELLGVNLPEDEGYDTVGGFMMAQFASVPRKGLELRHNGVLLRVLDSDDRRVRRVLLQRLEGEDSERSE